MISESIQRPVFNQRTNPQHITNLYPMKATTMTRTTMMAQVTPAMISVGTRSSAFSWTLGSEKMKAATSWAWGLVTDKTALHSTMFPFFLFYLLEHWCSDQSEHRTNPVCLDSPKHLEQNCKIMTSPVTAQRIIMDIAEQEQYNMGAF